ncbi:hypothetical protein MASR1M45_06390 [Candidatus Kapaibacterium sp.]
MNLVKLLLVVFLIIPIISSCGYDIDEKLLLARSNINKGSFETARYYLETVIKEDSSRGEAYLLFGKLENKEENFEAAISHLNKVISADPTNLEAFKERAYSNRRLGLYQNAIKDLSRLLIIYDKDGSIFFERGNVYFDNNELDNACQDWKRAFELGYGEADRVYQKFCVKVEISE